jgi:hypothetical protein
MLIVLYAVFTSHTQYLVVVEILGPLADKAPVETVPFEPDVLEDAILSDPLTAVEDTSPEEAEADEDKVGLLGLCRVLLGFLTPPSPSTPAS